MIGQSFRIISSSGNSEEGGSDLEGEVFLTQAILGLCYWLLRPGWFVVTNGREREFPADAS